MFGRSKKTAPAGKSAAPSKPSKASIAPPPEDEPSDNVQLDADDLAQLDEDDAAAARRKKAQQQKRAAAAASASKGNRRGSTGKAAAAASAGDEFGGEDEDIDVNKILMNARKAASEVMDLGFDEHNMNFDEKDLENDPELLGELAGLHEGDGDLAELEDGGGVGGIESRIVEMEAQVKALQVEAIQHKRSGDKAKALEVMRAMKAAKGELDDLKVKKEEYEKRKAAADAALEAEDPDLLAELKGLSLHGEDDDTGKQDEPAEVDYDAQIAEWEDRIKKAAQQALAFKKSGDKEKALQAMKHYKALQEKFQEFKKDVDQLRELKTEPHVVEPGDVGENAGDGVALIEDVKLSKEDEQKVEIVQKRIKEYQQRALEHKRNGTTDIAKQILVEVKKMKELAELVEFGEGDFKSLPKPIGDRKEYSLDAKATEREPELSAQSHSSSTTSVSSSRPSRGAKAKVEFQAIITRLSEQLNQAEDDVKTIMETAKGQPQTELPAIKRRLRVAVEIKTRILKDLDMVKAAATQGLPPPAYHIEHSTVERELYFPDIKKNEMVIHVKEGVDLKPADGWSVSTSSLTVEFGLPSLAKSSKTAPTIENDDNPKFDFKAVFPIPAANKIGRSFKFAKVEFRITSPRLFGSVLLGEGEMKIGDLTDKCELNAEVQLKRKGRPAGKLVVVVRIRQPFKGKDIRQMPADLLVIDHFYENEATASSITPVMDPSLEAKVERLRKKSSGKAGEGVSKQKPPESAPESAKPVSKSVKPEHREQPAAPQGEEKHAAPAPTPTKKAPPPETLDRSMSSALVTDQAAIGGIPDDIDPNDWKRPHNMDLLVSNDVLQTEFETVSTAIATARAKKLAANPILEDRYKKCQLKMMLLQSQVEDGELTLPMYLQRVKESMAYQTKLVKALKAANRMEDAKKALSRVKIMIEEVENAEASQKNDSE